MESEPVTFPTLWLLSRFVHRAELVGNIHLLGKETQHAGALGEGPGGGGSVSSVSRSLRLRTRVFPPGSNPSSKPPSESTEQLH